MNSGCKKWLDLLGSTTYKLFCDKLNDEEIVMMDDLLGIVTFVYPQAVQILLNNPAMQ